LEISKILVFVFPFSGGGTYDKVTTAFRFLVVLLVLHLNVLAKHNKWNILQVKMSFIASSVPAYFENSGPSDKYQ